MTERHTIPPVHESENLRAIFLREASGDEKEIEFSKMEKNAKLPADAFKP